MAELAPIALSWTRINEIGKRSTNQDTIGEAYREQLACFRDQPSFGPAALLGYAKHASDEVARRKRTEHRYADMSTTVAALLIDLARGQALWAHLGDSRVYLFRNARLHAMSKDHSLTQQLIDAGYARAEQLRVHPQRNILFAAIGAEGDTQVELSAGAVGLLPGDALLMCSDGLWEWVMEADMERTLAQSSSPDQWLAAMCRLADDNIANTGKVRDNYSAYAIVVKGAPA